MEWFWGTNLEHVLLSAVFYQQHEFLTIKTTEQDELKR